MPNWNAWSEESTEQLKALWATGLSASQIACRIRGTTRNGILGKVHRLNLESRRPSHIVAQTREEYNAKQRAARASRAIMQLENGYTPSLASLYGKARHMLPRPWKTRHASPVPSPAYSGEPVSILEVTGCKYAVESEGSSHRFCNTPSDGRPWCPYHEGIVWRPL